MSLWPYFFLFNIIAKPFRKFNYHMLFVFFHFRNIGYEGSNVELLGTERWSIWLCSKRFAQWPHKSCLYPLLVQKKDVMWKYFKTIFYSCCGALLMRGYYYCCFLILNYYYFIILLIIILTYSIFLYYFSLCGYSRVWLYILLMNKAKKKKDYCYKSNLIYTISVYFYFAYFLISFFF